MASFFYTPERTKVYVILIDTTTAMIKRTRGIYTLKITLQSCLKYKNAFVEINYTEKDGESIHAQN